MTHLEEEYAKHPFDPECICKLCNWRREGDVRYPEPVPDINFRDFHDAFRQRNRMGRWFYRGSTPYVRERAPGEVKGKQARKAAKKERARLRNEQTDLSPVRAA